MEHSVRFAVIRPHGQVCMQLRGGWKIASDLLTFLSLCMESNIEHSLW